LGARAFIVLWVVLGVVLAWPLLAPSLWGRHGLPGSREALVDEIDRINHLADARLLFALVGPFISSTISRRLARRWALAASEAAAPSEDENRRILDRSRARSRPFTLFLRSFDEESRSMGALPGMPFSSTARVDRATRWIEAEIVDEFARRGREVFCLTNPSERFSLPGARRLTASAGDWLSEIGGLAADAETVVAYVSGRSPGLLSELELLRRRNFIGKCILVLGRATSRREDIDRGKFDPVVVAPSLSRLNRTTSGPLFGRSRFRHALIVAIDKVASRRGASSSAAISPSNVVG
jgi:hypothetical protein